jgi:hypothetical protein
VGDPADGLGDHRHAGLDGRHDLENVPMTRQIPLPDGKPPRLGDFPDDRVEVACNKCGRAGNYAKARLVERFGADCTFLTLRRHFEKTCDRSNDIARLNEVCGVMFPDLVRWQLGQ